MKISTTLFLKISIIFIGISLLIVGIVGLSWLIDHPINPKYSTILYPIIFGLYLTSIPFYIALFNAIKLLSLIDDDRAFSISSVKILKKIRICAIAVSFIYGLIIPFVYLLAERDDAPGLIIFGMIPLFASLVIALFSAVLEKLFQEALEIKSDNDLTV